MAQLPRVSKSCRISSHKRGILGIRREPAAGSRHHVEGRRRMHFWGGKLKVQPLIALEQLSCKIAAVWGSADSPVFSQCIKRSSGRSYAFLVCNIIMLWVQKDDIFSLKTLPKWEGVKNSVVFFRSWLELALFRGKSSDILSFWVAGKLSEFESYKLCPGVIPPPSYLGTWSFLSPPGSCCAPKRC